MFGAFCKVDGFSFVVLSVGGAFFEACSLSVSMGFVDLLVDWLSLAVVDCCGFDRLILIFFLGTVGDGSDPLDRFDFDGDFVVLADFDFDDVLVVVDGGCFIGDASVKLITSVGRGIVGGMFF